MSETELESLLRLRYPAQEWAFFAQVRNGTGYTKRVTRTADALALGLWPSRGMELHGFEIKCSRSDWKREGADPEKAEEIAAYCDRWWVVVADAKIVRDGELPPTWGLLAADGDKLKCVREADKRADVRPLDRSFVAAVLRAAARDEHEDFRKRLAAGIEAGIAEERKTWKAEHDAAEETIESLTAERSALRERLEAVTGERYRYRLESMLHTATRIVEETTRALVPLAPKAPPSTETPSTNQ